MSKDSIQSHSAQEHGGNKRISNFYVFTPILNILKILDFFILFFYYYSYFLINFFIIDLIPVNHNK